MTSEMIIYTGYTLNKFCYRDNPNLMNKETFNLNI